MRRTFVYAALLALAGITPAVAEKVYVPVLGLAAADGSALPTQVWVNRAEKATRVSTTSEARLLAVDARSADDVYAWVNDGRLTQTPVIGSYDTFHEGARPGMAFDKGYDRLLVGAANVSDRRASCQATLFGAAHEELARIPFEVEAKGLYREDAAAWTRARVAAAEVTCDREFAPLGASTTASDSTRVVFAKSTGPNGACNKIVVPVRQNDGSWEVNVEGVFHQASLADPKAIVCVRAPADVSASSWRLARVTTDWDVTVGPWWSKHPDGIHNMGYFFGNRYRSGVIGNFNGLGPGKFLIKNMQNVGMPRGLNTNVKASYHLENGKLYHTSYTYDASNKAAHTSLQDSNHSVLKTLDQGANPGNNQTLVLDKYGSNGVNDMVMVCEFGNYNSHVPGHPEVPTPGWVYGNLHLRFVAK